MVSYFQGFKVPGFKDLEFRVLGVFQGCRTLGSQSLKNKSEFWEQGGYARPQLSLSEG